MHTRVMAFLLVLLLIGTGRITVQPLPAYGTNQSEESIVAYRPSEQASVQDTGPVHTVSDTYFTEPYRLQFHYSPERNWMNDPNGLVYHNGIYHLFYQYNPHGTQWGNMSWGHATSDDLLHWEHREVAIPVTDGVEAWSGSAVVDHQNTTGFGSPANPPIVAIYTGHVPGQPQTQHLAYSTDDGETWAIYDENPVLDIDNYDFRDPKVFWHEDTARWIMVVARAVERVIDFYASDDLKNWEFLSEFGPQGSVDGVWECPDLFELAVDGYPGRTKWVLQVDVTSHAPAGGSGAQYFVGEFDGTSFTTDDPAEYIPEGKVFDDFEREDHGDWEVTGEAFGDGPVTGTLPDQQPVVGYLGERLINSYHNGDATRGTMTSPAFTITYDYINFLIGGGHHPGEVGMDLVIDGESVRSATGENSERLDWHSWQVSELAGREARLKIYDDHTGGWGHILVDHIMFSDEPARPRQKITDWVDYGADFYATQSWSDITETDGRRIWLAWMSNWMYAGALPTFTWRGSMSVPREVGLTEQNGKIMLTQQPVRELGTLHGENVSLSDMDVSGSYPLSDRHDFRSATLDIRGAFDPGDAREIGIRFDYGNGNIARVGYNTNRGEFFSDRARSGDTGFHEDFGTVHRTDFEVIDDSVGFRILLDHSSLEFFADDGRVVFTNRIFPPQHDPEIILYATNGTAHIHYLDTRKLHSVWRERDTSAGQPDKSAKFNLEQNYPNPFNADTRINFSLPRESEVTIKVFDVTGRLVDVIHDGRKSAGHHQIVWQAQPGIASGIYLYRLTTPEKQIARKMMLLK